MPLEELLEKIMDATGYDIIYNQFTFNVDNVKVIYG